MAALDPSQLAAATADHPVQLVLAGPGSGKTTTLVGRFKHLVEGGTDPRRILALTFTRKAAEEMRGRIARETALAPEDLRCFTFHSLALRCLQRNPRLAGLPERFDVWTAAQGRALFSGRRMFWNEDGDILDIIGSAKEQLLDADGFEAALGPDDETGRLAARFFRLYEESIREAGAIDFADMVPRLLRAIADHPAYGQSVAGAVDHLLVDEYQDVNLGQHRLIEHFRAAGVRLWAVGDDDQTLFSFRAADVRYTLQFAARYGGGAVVHLLGRNYRSAPEIIEGAKRLIARNKNRFAKDYGPAVAEKGSVAVRGYSTLEIEVRQVTRAIAALLRGGMPPQSIAVLYRVGSLGLGFQSALGAMHIPFEVRGAGDLWQSAAAKLFLGSLFHLFDEDDSRAVERMGTGKRAEATRRKLEALPPAQRRSFRHACRKVHAIVAAALPKKSAHRERRDWTNICDALAALAATCASLDALLGTIAEQSRSARAPSERAVVLSTVHSAKGLEWDAVFVVGMEEGLMPATGPDLEEERRIAYVAVTRARRILGLTYALERGGTASKRSRFIAEFTGGRCEETTPADGGADERLPLHAPGLPAGTQPPSPGRDGGTKRLARRIGTRDPTRDRGEQAKPCRGSRS